MLFDSVLNTLISDDEIMIVESGSSNSPMVCSHCHKIIKGRFFQSGENYYDEYCWQFKFIIDPLYIERASRRGIKEMKDDEY